MGLKMGVKTRVYKMQNHTREHETQFVDELGNMRFQLSILFSILCIQDCSVNVFRFKYHPLY